MIHFTTRHPLSNEATLATDPGTAAGSGGGAPTAFSSTATPPAEPRVRPEHFPEKYWKDGGPADVEALARGYTELNRAFSARNPHIAEVPASAKDYNFIPAELPAGVSVAPEVADRFRSVFHTNQIGNSQAKAIFQAWAEAESENLTQATRAYDDMLSRERAALDERWGGREAAEIKKREVAAMVSEKLGADPENDAILFSNPRVVEFLGATHDYVKALEAKLGEDSLAAAKGAIGVSPAFSGGREEATRIMRDPAHPDHQAYLNGDPALVRRVMGLLGAGEG